MREQIKRSQGPSPETQGKNLASTVVCVPCSLDSGGAAESEYIYIYIYIESGLTNKPENERYDAREREEREQASI